MNGENVPDAIARAQESGLRGYSPPERPWQDRWRELAPGVLVRRHRTLDLNVTLVLGDERCLVIDTTSHARQAGELLDAVRSITSLPWVALDTHAHFDHCFGNATFAAAQPGLEIWAHARCAQALADFGDLQREMTVAWLRETGDDEDADAVAAVEIMLPNRTFTDEVVLDLGGRRLTAWHPGRGHTDHDVVVDIPDAGVTVVGDLVEEGAPPSFDDGFPLDWAVTLHTLIPRLQHVVVPGHGDVVDPAFVEAQREAIAEVAVAVRALPTPADDFAIARAATRLRIGREAGYTALRRALAAQ